MDLAPTSTPTFLFTDIEGSTRRWDEAPMAMDAALRCHDDLVRAAVEGHGGHVFKTIGDAFCAVFADPVAAVTAAVAAQLAIRDQDWAMFGQDFAPLAVRMGIHTGRADVREGDYFGPCVNRTARLMAAGHGGQVLVSLVTQQLVRDALPPSTSLRDWGEHRLQDLRFSEHIFQVLAPDLPEVTLPLRTAQRLRPRDRIVVDPGAAASPLPESMGRMLSVIRDEADTVTLPPDLASDVARRRPKDLTEYRLGRIAKWSLPRYRLDHRFVALTLLVDHGEEALDGRWHSRPEHLAGLRAALAGCPDPAVVLLGPPGSGKSTLMRHFELDTAIAALRGEDPRDTVTFFIQLNQYRADPPGAPLPSPEAWLEARWAERFPDLPPLGTFLTEGRAVLLLDGLNEIPVGADVTVRQVVQLWKDWLQRLLTRTPHNRVIFSCRTLDYSAPLSSPTLRVPQLRIEPLSDAQMECFLRLYSPLQGEVVWRALAGTPAVDALRSPYYLALLVEQVENDAGVARDRAALITAFVRQALKHEIERDNPLLAPDVLLTERDVRRLTQWQWHDPYELPERGPLLPGLAALAYGMQARHPGAGLSQLRVRYDEALRLADHPRGEDLIRAGSALALLDEDQASDEVLFRHQLLQEYFAARRVAQAPDPSLVQSDWRADAALPSLAYLVTALPPAEALPSLPTTGWEETMLLAATMSGDAESLIRGLMPANLALAGRCAAQPSLRPRLAPALKAELRQALVDRSRDPAADLRARIEAGLALGQLGEPRFERRHGPNGTALVPPLVAVPAGTYPIGDDDDIVVYGHTWHAHQPRHDLALPAFAIGRFLVTNGEFARFVAAGGYDDERWWDTAAARAWRSGEATVEGLRSNRRWWRREFQRRPERLTEFTEQGVLGKDNVRDWQAWLAMTDEAFEAALAARWPNARVTLPFWWRHETFNKPAQPVCGVTWYEARAYCAWLSAQIGLPFRLPTEVEWEAAARGPDGRRYAYGDTFDSWRANTAETHVRRPTPVGVFVEGDTPLGISDLTGNVQEWTASLWGRDILEPDYPYPYHASDGREDTAAPGDVMRVTRGGGWNAHRDQARCVLRDPYHPDDRGNYCGFRLAMTPRA